MSGFHEKQLISRHDEIHELSINTISVQRLFHSLSFRGARVFYHRGYSPRKKNRIAVV
jgi:hypothetical protein